MKEQLALKAQALHQHIHEIEEQINFIEHQLAEFEGIGELTNESIGEKGNDNGVFEFLAPIGKGIYVKSEAKEKSFLVNVGAGVFIRKSKKELRKIIENQVKSMGSIKSGLRERHEIFSEELIKTASILEKENSN